MRIGLVCIVVLATACSSSNKKALPPPTTSTATTTLPSTAGRDALVFREVVATLPFGDSTSRTTPDRTPSPPPGVTSCKGGALVTPSNEDTPASLQVILPSRDKTLCYVLGRALLTGRSVSSAVAMKDPNGGWDVSVHFSNDDFVNRIGRPLVGKNVAIIYEHVVQSAPVIQEAITTPDALISSNLDERAARELARALS